MLDNLRGFASTLPGKILGGVLLVGLAGFGISGVLTTIGSNTVANVGGKDITIRDFQRAYNNQLNSVASQTGSVPTAEQALAMGVPSAALARLSSEAALTSLGERLGLGVSDERLGRLVREDPNFSGLLGAFDEANFERVLQQNGYTENEYFEDQREAAKRQQVSVGLFGGVMAPATAASLVSRYSGDQRTIDYFVISSTTIAAPDKPTEEEMQSYLEDNQAQFRTQPSRTAAVMVLSPEAIAESIELSDAEIAEEYERTQASYQTIEQRTIEQVVLSSDLLVDLFEAGQAEGKSFADLVAETGLPVTSLGTLSRGEINDQRLAEAAFTLEEGAFTLLPAPLGQRAVSVSEIVPAGQQSLDEARDDVAERLKLRRARDMYADILDEIEELRAAFRPLDEIAERYDLAVEEVEVTSSGSALSTVAGIPDEGRGRVATAIFNATEGSLSPTVALSANLNVWFDLKAVNPARDQTLDEVRDEIQAQQIAERTDAALANAADEMVAEIEAGAALPDVAAARSQFPQLSQPFNRSGDGSPVVDAQVAAAAFSGGPGHIGSARNADGDYVVFEVVDITSAEEQPQATEFVQRVVVDSIFNGFVTGLRDDSGMRVNESVLMQTLGLDGSQQ